MGKVSFSDLKMKLIGFALMDRLSAGDRGHYPSSGVDSATDRILFPPESPG